MRHQRHPAKEADRTTHRPTEQHHEPAPGEIQAPAPATARQATPTIKENHMRDIATATLSGNLTRDVELKQLSSGAEVARLRVASSARRRHGEEWVEKTNYFTIEVYGAQARACAQYLARGSRVLVDAEPDWREWTDQQQNRREAVTFRARQVLFEGSPRATDAADDGARDNASPAPAQPAVEVGAGSATEGTATADDLPF